MIKFWKSNAKGKSLFPVRPPERNFVPNNQTPFLETIHENEDDSHIFEKKSRLTLKLYDVLQDDNLLKYFYMYMQSIGKIMLIKCWLELEDFRLSIVKKVTCEGNRGPSICRTKSFDLDWNSMEDKSQNKDFLSGSLSFKINNNLSKVRKNKFAASDCSSNSCMNLSEQKSVIGKSTDCVNENSVNSVTDEAVRLFKKYIALEAPQSIVLPDNVRKTVISNICHPQGQINEDCFKPVLEVLFKQMEMQYFEDFQKSTFHIKAQIDILTNGTLNLNDILYNEGILFYFTEYLEQECGSLLLEFLMSIMHFRNNLINNANDTQQAQEDAIIIYEKYFSLQATSPIGFSTEVRLRVESEICREGGPLCICFDIPYRIVYKTLTNYVKTFLESEMYYKYLSEMINSEEYGSSHRRSHSDCSSEFSISTQNTLLAMGDTVFNKNKRHHSVPDMTIDSNQLYNADSLWQRKRQDGLSLGRINSLGRFESKFEPDPDKKDKSVFKKMVSRFVPINKSSIEEEMAWQIAHMIVKDVTDLTMAPPENDRDNNV